MADYERVTAQINMNALACNIRNIKNLTKNNVKIMAVIKADAYGHGAAETAQTLLNNGADWFGVAIPEEGIQLRMNNINVPILILGYTPPLQIEKIIKYDIMQTVFSIEMARYISETAQKLGKTAKIHIKIDTGMGRIGFQAGEDAVKSIVEISKFPNLELNGVYTHFSTSDESDKSFTRIQYEKFTADINKLESMGICFPIKHAANSAGVIEFEDMFFNMVRPGIILYGLYPSKNVNKEKLKLKPVMSIKSCISFVKNLPENSTVGYGREFITKRKSIIATVPVGYADGYSRNMKNGGRVIINGQFAPVVGRICMDQFMVDITDIKGGVKIGDEVIILGQNGENEITAEELAEIMKTINYEVVCMISKRVPRKYIEDGKVIKTVNYI